MQRRPVSARTNSKSSTRKDATASPVPNVSVVSPRYVRSEWTQRELNEFVKAAQQQGGVSLQHKARIFKVLKTPVPRDQQTAELQSLLG